MPKNNREVKDAYAQVIQVQAYFHKDQERQAGDGNDEDEVEDALDEEDFVELELEEEIAVESGAPNAKARSVPLRERMMMKKRGKEKEIEVKGKFLMDGPWWIASFKAVKEGAVYICQGPPTYTLRYKQGQKGKSLLLQLLSYVFKCPELGSAAFQMKEAFWDYFEEWHGIKKKTDYTFHQFFTALEDALNKKTTPDDTTAIPMMQVAKVIMQRFDPSNGCFSPKSRNRDEKEKKPNFDLWYVYRCFKFPQLFKVLPLLMERVALSILSTEKLGDLERLESVLKNSPEDLGFYTSMREHNWGTIEVSFQGFVNAGMIPPNLFKCTANQDSALPPSSKSSGKQNCTLDQPSTSTANQDTVGPSSSKPNTKQNSTPKLSVEMAKVLKLYDIVKSRCKDGKHTFLYESDMETEWRKDACKNVSFGHIRDEPFVELQNRKVVKIEEKTSQSDVKFHWSKYRRYEESIARSIERLLNQHKAEPWTLPVEDFSEFNFDPHQQEAALHVCKNALTVILGRGGCGKTHVVASIIRKYLDHLEENRRLTKMKEPSKKMQDGERAVCSEDTKDEKEGNDGDREEEKDEDRDKPVILLTAPTGRAASILKRRTGMKATTLHSVLGTARKSNHGIFSNVEILVVDECSLVPISVLSEVLSRLLDYSLKKVIFLGDQHQLPSIDPGNFLQDIIKVFQTTNLNFIQTLKKNHRADEGGRLIVENARRIAEERRSDLVYEPDRFEMIDTSDCEAGKGQQQILDRLIKTKRQLQDHKNSQIVAFRNIDVENINIVCCHYYAAHATFRKGQRHNHHIDDKICARKNSTITIKKQEVQREGEAEGSEVDVDNQKQREGQAGPSKTKEEKISNGDTFFIENWREVVENNRKKRDIVTLQSMDEEEGTLFDVDFKEMRSRSKIQYAWARTINTFQGSEVDYIVYVISSNCFYENWQHLYTAITRGCKGCIIVGTLARLQEVVKENPKLRQTSLARFLRENLRELLISRPNLGEVDPRTPERPVPRNVSSSNRAIECSPCQLAPAQEQPGRGSPFHLLSSSNQATPSRSPHQQSPWGRQEVPVNKSLSNGPSTSSATPVHSLAEANKSTCNTPSISSATPVQSLARLNEMASLLKCVSLTAPARAVPVPGCTPSVADLPGFTSLAADIPVCKTSVVASLAYKISPVASPGCTSSAVDRHGSKPLAEVVTPSVVKAKPNRENRSLKRKVKSNPVPVNQDVPCLQGGESTVTMDSEVPKKKSCASKPSLAVSPMAVAEQEHLDKDQVSASNGTEQAKRTSSPQQREGDPFFTSIPPKEESTPVVPSRKSGFTFSRRRLKLARETENKDVQNMSKGNKVETLTADGQTSPLAPPGYKASAVASPGFTPLAADLPGSKPLAEVVTPSDVKAKPNRENLSLKRKVKSNPVPVNQDVPCLQGGESTVTMDSEVPKKKSCASKPSLAVSPMAVAEQEHLDKDQVSASNGIKQAKRTSSPQQREGDPFFTSIPPKEESTPVVPSRKSGFTFSRKRLKLARETENKDVQNMSKGNKVETLTADGQTSPLAPPGYKASAVASPGFTPLAADLPGSKPLAEVVTPSDVKAKPNREKLSLKRKVKSNPVPVNQDVPRLQGGDSTVTMDSEVPKKKSCASKPSPAVSPMAVAEQKHLDKDQVSVSNGTEQAKGTSSPQQCEGDSLFTSILPKKEITPVAPNCKSDGDDRKPRFKFSRKCLKFPRETKNKDVQNMTKGVKVKTLPADGQGSPETSHSYGKESHNEPFRGSRGKMDVKESPKGFRSPSDSRSPLKSQALISNAVLKSVLSKSPQGEEKDQSPRVPKLKDVQENTPRVQPKQQSVGNRQESLICVPCLSRGRFQNGRRLYSQESEELPTSPSRKSNDCKEECLFKDSCDQELSEILLQPPSTLQIHPLLKGPDKCQKDDDNDCTDCSRSSDETAFSSSGSSPCLGTGGYTSVVNDDDGGGDDQDNVFEDDDEDEEMSQFIKQNLDEIESSWGI